MFYRTDKKTNRGLQTLMRLYVATALVHVPTLLWYETARRIGLLPGEETWRQMGGDTAGPLGWSFGGLLLNIILMAAVCLPFLTLAWLPRTVCRSQPRRFLTLIIGLALITFQCWSGIALVRQIGWVSIID